MRPFFFIVLLFLSATAFGQENSVVWMDFIKVKNGHYKEALYFYENNWKLYRDSALKAGHIKSYRLVQTASDSTGVDFVLQTEYHNLESYQRREEFFQPIMKALRPNGPVLTNGLKRDDILTITQSFLAKVVF